MTPFLSTPIEITCRWGDLRPLDISPFISAKVA